MLPAKLVAALDMVDLEFPRTPLATFLPMSLPIVRVAERAAFFTLFSKAESDDLAFRVAVGCTAAEEAVFFRVV